MVGFHIVAIFSSMVWPSLFSYYATLCCLRFQLVRVSFRTSKIFRFNHCSFKTKFIFYGIWLNSVHTGSFWASKISIGIPILCNIFFENTSLNLICDVDSFDQIYFYFTASQDIVHLLHDFPKLCTALSEHKYFLFIFIHDFFFIFFYKRKIHTNFMQFKINHYISHYQLALSR